MTFALYFGNRGFFPGELIASAREEMTEAVKKAGHDFILMDESLTRYGAVETVAEGKKYAAFLEENRSKFEGVILCLPNFGDENGAISALRDANVPILVQAYPDELGKMDFDSRRDSFCGKLSIMDVFYQYGVKYTAFKPHTIHPLDPRFIEQIKEFARVCRITNKMKRFSIGAIGARTTAFKTVRYDELTLQKYGITVEALDLTELYSRVNKMDESRIASKAEALRNFTNFSCVPNDKVDTLAKISLAIDDIIKDYNLDCIALRCWEELEKDYGVSPCVLLGELNDRMIPAACELDVCNAVTMLALSEASLCASTCLDWNNNYEDDENKCILFHCGPVPQSLMTEKGNVIDHKMFSKSFGKGCGFGANEGIIKPMEMTFASSRTENGKLYTYLGKGTFTEDKFDKEFFGCGGVALIDNLQDVMQHVGKNGYRHHVSVTEGNVYSAMKEAFENYLGYELHAF